MLHHPCASSHHFNQVSSKLLTITSWLDVQHARIRLARHDGPHDGHAREARDVGDDMMERSRVGGSQVLKAGTITVAVIFALAHVEELMATNTLPGRDPQMD